MTAVIYSQEATPGLVTVVIPAYRADDCLGEALAAIDGQTYSNWEVIVVEDASQGMTQAIVQDFAKEHPQHRVAYFRNEKNRGPSHTRNVAFQEARGEFIALLDADDRWFQTHLAANVQAVALTPIKPTFSVKLKTLIVQTHFLIIDFYSAE